MAQFPAVIQLSSLNGTNGFKLSGGAAGDQSGYSVASAGDVNGDGFADVIVGAGGADPNGTQSGASYVVFGQASGFASNINLSSLNGSNGFKLNGVATTDTSGGSVASAGDVNGDGFADLIVGADEADPNGSSSGASYVVFGQASGFAASLELSSLNGSNGFKLSGVAASDHSGGSVASAGDVNGDGFADLIVSADQADPNGSNSGASYVVFGQASGFASNLNLSSLDGSNGFKLSGGAADDRSGISVASAGDINGDSFADVIVGAAGADPNGLSSGASYVVFGQASSFASNINLSSLDGSNGFKLSGETIADNSGRSVGSAGDVNGDGFADLVVGAFGADPNSSGSGASYVVFGQASGFTANIDLSSLNGSNGFKLSGVATYDKSGRSVASAGDVNGDGFADLIVGAYDADPNGVNSGASYVVFGKASGFAANINLSNLDGSSGFKLSGVAAGDYSGRPVASAGDVNGDGFADLIVGASFADPNGAASGASYVVFGIAPTTAVTRTGTDISQTLAGGALGDTLSGLGGDDDLFGHGGDDVIDGGLGDDTLRGGAGADELIGSGGKDKLYGEAGDDQLDGGTGDDWLDGGDGNNVLIGGSGNDVLLGGLGDDEIDGGTGDDFIGAGDGFNAVAGGLGDDILIGGEDDDELNGDGGHDTLNGLEGDDALAGGTGNDTLRGDAGNDQLSGDAGNDTLLGGTGDDDMDGGTGTDTVDYSLATAGVSVSLSLATEQDTGGAGIDTLFRFENLIGSHHVDLLTGTGSANVLTGLNGDDDLNGLGGADTLVGGEGSDKMSGGSGADVLIGGAGRDVLTGGSDADTFRYLSFTDTGTGGTTRDRIVDFAAGVDKIDLAAIDANIVGGGANDAFAFIGAAAFSNTAGQLRAAAFGTNTLVMGDVNGDGGADFHILLSGTFVLSAGDFLL